MGWQEFLFLIVLILILVKPKDMPRLMREAGEFLGSLKRQWSDFQQEMERTENNIRIQTEELLEIEKNTPVETVSLKSSKKKNGTKKTK